MQATTITQNTGRGIGLAQLTALGCVIALMAGMAAWGIAQLAIDPSARPIRVFAEHSGHVVLLGATIYFVVYFLFRRWLMTPLRRVSSHLYGVATGRLEPLVLQSRVAEVDRLVSSVNLMVRRMKQGLDPEAVDDTQARLAALRALATTLRERNESELADELLDHTRRLSVALATVTEGSAVSATTSERPPAMNSGTPVE